MKILFLIVSLLILTSLQQIHRHIKLNKHKKSSIKNQNYLHSKELCRKDIKQQLIQLKNLDEGIVCNRDIDNFVYEPKSNYYVVQQEEQQNPGYSDIYGRFQILWGNASLYHRENNYLGGGTFSEVYMGTIMAKNKPVVLKYFNDDKWDYVAKIEVKIEETLEGGPYIQQLVDTFRTNDSQLPFCLVYEFIAKTTLDELVNDLEADEIQIYMYQLLQALEFSHSKGIAHLDLKPSNLIIDQTNKQIQLIDWGISEFIISNREQVRRGTYEFAAPEALLEFKCCDFTLDSWSAGTLMACMLFQRDVIYTQTRGRGSTGEILANIANFYSEEEVNQTLSKLNVNMKQDFQQEYLQFRNTSSNQTYESVFINDNNRDLITDDGLDLMKKLLTFDYTQRISPHQALQHPYFDSIRQQSIQ